MASLVFDRGTQQHREPTVGGRENTVWGGSCAKIVGTGHCDVFAGFQRRQSLQKACEARHQHAHRTSAFERVDHDTRLPDGRDGQRGAILAPERLHTVCVRLPR